MLSKTIVLAVALLVTAGATADDCAQRTGAAMQDLQAAIPDMTAAQADAAREILEGFCEPGNAGSTVVSSEVAPATQKGASEPASEPELTSILGVEFERADEDAKGHSRLKKRH